MRVSGIGPAGVSLAVALVLGSAHCGPSSKLCSGQTSCTIAGDLVCTSLLTDNQHCGGCQTSCSAGQNCISGVCQSAAQDSGPADGGEGDAGPYPAASPPPPQVRNGSAPQAPGVLTNPQFVHIYFQGDNDPAAPVAEIKAFYAGLGASAYWSPLQEYGVGAPLPAVGVDLSEAAPPTIDDSTIQLWIVSEIDAGHLPQPTENTVYAINYPLGTTVTYGSQATSCQNFGGYHSDLQAGSMLIAYAVIPRCAPPDRTELQQLTGAASHEMVEASTDPWPDYDPGYAYSDQAHVFWAEATGGTEIGDLCLNDPEAYFQFPDFAYLVQRYWSNEAADAGHDPCVPDYPGEVFFNSAPVLNDPNIPFDLYGLPAFPVLGVNIAVGATATIPLQLYSDAPSSSWTVQVVDWNQRVSQDGQALLSFPNADDGGVLGTGENGQTLNLQVHVNADGGPPNGMGTNTELFMVVSTLDAGAPPIQHVWFGLIGN
jgi:hypothetical protein